MAVRGVAVLALLALVVSAGPLAAPPALAATPSTVVAWGCGGGYDYGQCIVPAGLSGVTAIAAREFHSLALKGDGTVVAWGCGGERIDAGQCIVPAGLSGVTAIAAGEFHSLALKNDGTVVAWGCGTDNPSIPHDFGQCTVPTGLSNVTAIAAGLFHSLALKNDGTVVAWGCEGGLNAGQCIVPAGLSGVTAIAAGYLHSLALKGDGTVVAWGCGGGLNMGQCTLPTGLSGVTTIAAGDYHSLALKGDGTVVVSGCGGGYDFGQCAVPAGLSGVTAIAAGYFHSLALKGDGTVVVWGCGGGYDFGQCAVPTGLSGVTAIATGYAHSLAIAPISAPVVITQPASQTVSAGQTATFTAAASGNPPPTVQWEASGDDGTTWTPQIGATATTLSFQMTTAQNGYLFRAVFSNPAGSTTTTTARLTLPSPPVTFIHLAPAAPDRPTGWYTAPVRVTITAISGGAGVQQTRCVLDPGSPPQSFDALPQTSPCPYLGAGGSVSAGGSHVLYAASVDNLSGKEAVRSVAFQIEYRVFLPLQER
jgi:hypothetical protein